MDHSSKERNTSAASRSSRRPTSTSHSSGGDVSPRQRHSRSRCARSRAKWMTEDSNRQRTSLELDRVFRAEYGRAVSVLVRLCGDIDDAEEAVQEAFRTAVERWP